MFKYYSIFNCIAWWNTKTEKGQQYVYSTKKILKFEGRGIIEKDPPITFTQLILEFFFLNRLKKGYISSNYYSENQGLRCILSNDHFEKWEDEPKLSNTVDR
jgi:hypothetical protein